MEIGRNGIDSVINKVKRELDFHDGDLLHGSKKGLDGNIKPISKLSCDFGTAFYVGNSIEQVITLVSSYNDGIIYKFSFESEGLKILDLRSNIDWALLVLSYRGFLNSEKVCDSFKHNGDFYDVIIGPIADDRLFDSMSLFLRGALTDIALINMLQCANIGTQLAFKTDKACSRLKITHSYVLTKEDKDIINSYKAIRKKKIQRITNDVMDTYRGQGNSLNQLIHKKEAEIDAGVFRL